MFVVSWKASKKQGVIALACIAAAVVIGLGAWLLPAAFTASAPVSRLAATEEERAALLTGLGLEIDGTAKVFEVRIPEEQDPTFEQYNTLLKQAGMDLSPYAGKRIKVYEYRVLGGTEKSGTARLYVYKNKAVAGDIAPLSDPSAIKPLF